MRSYIPWTTVCVFTVVVAAVVTLLVTGEANTTVVTVLVGLLPGVITGTAYAETTHKSITNGLVAEKAREGTQQALADNGIIPPAPKENGGNGPVHG